MPVTAVSQSPANSVLPGVQPKAPYNFLVRIDARIEGVLPADWWVVSRRVWVLRAKSARISVGEANQASRMVNTIFPYNPTALPHANIIGIAELPITMDSRDVAFWVLCDAPPSNATLRLQLEAVASDAKTHKPLRPRVVAPVEKFELRPFDVNNDSAND